MNKSTIFIGIDISKDVFDVYDSKTGYRQYGNTRLGIREFAKTLSNDHWCVMEATGCYHQQLALFLYESSFRLSVVNPLVVKRFIQMKLNHVKTDKSDAKMISHYGQEQSQTLWCPDPPYVESCKMIQSVTQLYFKQSTAIKNKIHALESRGHKRSKMLNSLKRTLKTLSKEIHILEEQLEVVIKENEKELYTHIKSIPGIGKKTAILLIISTNGFKGFESSKQVSSYLGLAPNERTSGSSVRGKSYISKRGHPMVRNHLFMCSFTACEYNPQCKALYNRIVNKGKSKKLALIAVCNKLIKQAYGIAKSGIEYDRNFISKSI